MFVLHSTSSTMNGSRWSYVSRLLFLFAHGQPPIQDGMTNGVLCFFTEVWNCSRGPNAQSNGIHPKESPTVYSDLADRIDTPLYGTTEHYQMTEDVSSNQQRTSARMTGCDDWRAAASATGFGDNER